MTDLRILTESHFEGGAFGSIQRDGCDVTGLANLLDSRCARVMRISPTRATRMTYRFGGNLPASRLADTFALGNLDGIPAGSTIEVAFYKDTNFTGENLTRTVTYAANIINWGDGDTWRTDLPHNIYIYLDEPYEYRSVRVSLSMTFGAGYADLAALIGRVLVGHAFSPRVGYAPGAGITDVDPSRHIRTSGGGLHTIGKRPYRRFTMSLNHLNPADRNILGAQLENVGKAADMLVTLDAGLTGKAAQDNALIGRLANDRTFGRPNVPWHTLSLVIDETCAKPVTATANLATKAPFLDVQTGEYAALSRTFSTSGEVVTINSPGQLLGKHMVSGNNTNIGEFTLTRTATGIRFGLKLGSTTEDGDNMTAAVNAISTLVRIDYGSHAVNVPGPDASASGDTDDPYTWTVESEQFKDMIDDMLAGGAPTAIVLTWLPGIAPIKALEPSGFVYGGEALSVELETATPIRLYMVVSDQLLLVDPVTPANSSVIGNLPASGFISLGSLGGVLYGFLIGNSNNVYTIDVNTPANSTVAGSIATPSGQWNSAAGHAGKLYIARGNLLHEFHADNIANPTLLGTVNAGSHYQLNGMTSHNGVLYGMASRTGFSAKLMIINTVTPSESTEVGLFPFGYRFAEALASFAGNMYLALEGITGDSSRGHPLSLVNLTSPELTQKVGNLPTSGADSFGFTAHGTSGTT